MMEDLNCHHNLWYAESAAETRIYNNIRNNKKHANALVEYREHHGFTLSNVPGTFTHFPRSTKKPTIIDLTFTNGHITTITTGWSCDPGSGGSSDHATTIVALNVGKLQFTPHRLHRLTDWQKFEAKINELELPANFGENADAALAAAEALNEQIRLAIDTAVPWSKPSSRAKKWWTPEITELKKRLATEKRSDWANYSHQVASALSKQAVNKWKKAIRRARWNYWEETFRESNRSNVYKAMRASDKPRAKESLPDIQGRSTFPGKCGALREALLPTNVATPPLSHLNG